MREYKIKDVLKILGIKKSRVQYYYDTGVIVPLRDSKGPGTNRYFSARNLAEILLAMKLTKIGVGIKTNADIIQGFARLEEHLNKEWIEKGVYSDGNKRSFLDPEAYDIKPRQDGNLFLSLQYDENTDEPKFSAQIIGSKNKYNRFDFPREDEVSLSSHIILVNLTMIKADLVGRLGIA